MRAPVVATCTLAFALISCDKPAPGSAPARPSPGANARLIPDDILSRLGSADLVLAVDLGHLDTRVLLAQLADDQKCARDVLTATHNIVVAIGHDVVGYATDMPQEATRACVTSIANELGTPVTRVENGFEVDIAGRSVTATWRGGLATFVERGHAPPSGEPSAAILALLASVPSDAQGVVAQVGAPTDQIKTTTGWLETHDNKLVLTVRFEGTKSGLAHGVANDLVSGFKQGAVLARWVSTVEDRWFVIHDNGPISTLVATVPYDFFAKK